MTTLIVAASLAALAPPAAPIGAVAIAFASPLLLLGGLVTAAFFYKPDQDEQSESEQSESEQSESEQSESESDD